MINEIKIEQKVLEYAAKKHNGQYRKDGIEPYINHPIRVSQIVEKFGGNLVMRSAAYCHDILEDCNVSFAQFQADLYAIFYSEIEMAPEYDISKGIRGKYALRYKQGILIPDHNSSIEPEINDFVFRTCALVDHLTCKYTPQAYPNLNRSKRKELEIKDFLKLSDDNAKIVKLADIIDNLSSIEKLDPQFAEKYLFEDFRIIRALKIIHPIYDEAIRVFKGAIGKML